MTKVGRSILMDYKCTSCGYTGCKLWREYGAVDSDLFCVFCVEVGSGRRVTDSNLRMAGKFVAAVSSKEVAGAYMPCSEQPEVTQGWWDVLPTVPVVDLAAARIIADKLFYAKRLHTLEVRWLAVYTSALLTQAEARAATLSKAKLGRPIKMPSTSLEQLVADACKARALQLGRKSYSKRELAVELGLGRSGTLLTPAVLAERGLSDVYKNTLTHMIDRLTVPDPGMTRLQNKK